VIAALREKQYRVAIKTLIGRPYILILNMVTIMKLVRTNSLNAWRIVKKRAAA